MMIIMWFALERIDPLQFSELEFVQLIYTHFLVLDGVQPNI
jgi:hypothetical protein